MPSRQPHYCRFHKLVAILVLIITFTLFYTSQNVQRSTSLSTITYKKMQEHHQQQKQLRSYKPEAATTTTDEVLDVDIDELIPTHRQQENLPDFTNGGIIVFYHIYKTGGSTVGKMLHELARLDESKYLRFGMLRKDVQWERDCLGSIEVASTSNKLMLLELHNEYPAPDFPSLVEMTPLLNKWRIEAHKQNLGFFAFTLVREPVQHALSFFNFFHVGWKANPQEPPDSWNPFNRLVPSEENFVKSFVGNRQCQMLGTDPEATLATPSDLVREEASSPPLPSYNNNEDPYDCHIDQVYDALFDSMDWVGTTENLQNETLPLLTKLILDEPEVGLNTESFKVYKNFNGGYRGLSQKDLSKETIQHIQKETQLDRQLYNDVAKIFTLDGLGWKKHFPKPKIKKYSPFGVEETSSKTKIKKDTNKV